MTNTSDLGPCMAPWCNRDAVVYVAGPTIGHSPRVTVIAGERARQLGAGAGGVSLRCLDCAFHEVERVSAGVIPAIGPEPWGRPVPDGDAR